VKQLGFFIILSILVHLILSEATLYVANRFYQGRSNIETTEIELAEEPQADPLQEKLDKARRLVKQLSRTVEEMKKPTAPARFESEKTQRVKIETKASIFGLSQNSKFIPQQAKAAEVEKKLFAKDGELPEFARTKAADTQVPVANNSAISSDLPSDIAQSDATNLNTDANTYYSFYSRVEELFYVRWVERTNYYWERIPFEYKKSTLAGKVWSTSLEVWLKSNGEYHSAYVRQSSGYKEFDEAAVFAFKDAKMFPNPPKAKVENDGFVRLRYRFNVHVAAY
jgi:TonB family protein